MGEVVGSRGRDQGRLDGHGGCHCGSRWLWIGIAGQGGREVGEQVAAPHGG